MPTDRARRGPLALLLALAPLLPPGCGPGAGGDGCGRAPPAARGGGAEAGEGRGPAAPLEFPFPRDARLEVEARAVGDRKRLAVRGPARGGTPADGGARVLASSESPPEAPFEASFEASFEVPSSWSHGPGESPALVVMASEPASVPGSRLNANLVVDPFPFDLERYARSNVGALRQMGGRVLREARARAQGEVDAHDVETAWSGSGGGGGGGGGGGNAAGSAGGSKPPYRTFQRFVVARGRALALTCSAPEPEAEARRAECEAILGSLRVK